MNRGSSGDVNMDLRTKKSWALMVYIALVTTLTLLVHIFGVPFVHGA